MGAKNCETIDDFCRKFLLPSVLPPNVIVISLLFALIMSLLSRNFFDFDLSAMQIVAIFVVFLQLLFTISRAIILARFSTTNWLKLIFSSKETLFAEATFRLNASSVLTGEELERIRIDLAQNNLSMGLASRLVAAARYILSAFILMVLIYYALSFANIYNHVNDLAAGRTSSLGEIEQHVVVLSATFDVFFQMFIPHLVLLQAAAFFVENYISSRGRTNLIWMSEFCLKHISEWKSEELQRSS